jgi:hypothetical protein
VRASLRVLSVVVGAVMATAAMAPGVATAAGTQATTRFDVYHHDGANNYEYRWGCTVTTPFTCYTYAGAVAFSVVVTNRPKPLRPITINYVIDDITAVNGVNYTGATSGTLTIPSTPIGRNDVMLALPIIDTGSNGAPAKTLRMRLTGSSVPGANISDDAIGSIKSAGQIPRDCTPSVLDALTFSTTCTGRPPTSQWRAWVTCLEGFMGISVMGPTITGNGTSTATCAGTGFDHMYWNFQLIS